MDPTPDEVDAGHAFYTKRSLAVYDLAILWYFSRLAWKCPAPRILQHYDAHVTPNHLDVGVGTGYFLDKCGFGTDAPRWPSWTSATPASRWPPGGWPVTHPRCTSATSSSRSPSMPPSSTRWG